MHHHLRERDYKPDHDALDDHEGHRAPIDLAGRHGLHLDAGDFVVVRLFRRHRSQVEQRETERWMHEARLHVDAEDDAEPDQVDAELLGGGPEQRHDDEGQLEKVEEECQQEHHDVDEDQEANLATRQRRQQMLDPDVTVHAVKRQREDTSADENEDHERRELGRCFHGRTQKGDVETLGVVVEPTLEHRQQDRAGGSHRATFSGRGDTDKDRAQYEEDQEQRRHHYEGDLLCHQRQEPQAGQFGENPIHHRCSESKDNTDAHAQDDEFGTGISGAPHHGDANNRRDYSQQQQ